MGKMVKTGVIAMMLVVTAVCASAAQAATWRYSSTSATLTATGPAIKFVTAGGTLTCSGSSMLFSGPAAGTYTGPTYPSTWTHVPSPATALQITLRFTNCRIGATPYTVKCNGDESPPVPGAYLNATSTTATSAVGGATSFNLSSIDCNVYVGTGTTNFCAKITSTGANVTSASDRIGLTGTYTNPTVAGGTGTFTLNASGQTLTSNTMGSGCVLGNGDVRLTNTSGGNVTETVAASLSIWQA